MSQVVPIRGECCRRLADDYEKRLAEVSEALHLAEKDLRAHRAMLTKERNRNQENDQRSQLRPHAEDIFQFWKEQIAPRATAFSGKRLKNVLDRLAEGRENIEARKEELREAILGAKATAYVNPKTGVKYDDLELICRDDSIVRRFSQAHRASRINPLLRARARRPVANEPRRPHHDAPPIAWVAYRIDVAGQWFVEGDRQIIYFPCLHHGFDGQLAYAQPIGSGRHTFVRLHCTAGCEEDDIMEAYLIEGTDLISTTTIRS